VVTTDRGSKAIEPGIVNMSESNDHPKSNLIDYDREELRAELARAVAEIDDEIRSLITAAAVTRAVLEIEFTV
jgi:hypothetical protein